MTSVPVSTYYVGVGAGPCGRLPAPMSSGSTPKLPRSWRRSNSGVPGRHGSGRQRRRGWDGKEPTWSIASIRRQHGCRRIPAGAFAHGILLQPQVVWISNAHEDTVTRIDPSTNEALFVDGPGSGVGLGEGSETSGPLLAMETSTASTRRPVRRSRWCTSVAGPMASLRRTPRYGCPTASTPCTGSPSASSMSSPRSGRPLRRRRLARARGRMRTRDFSRLPSHRVAR